MPTDQPLLLFLVLVAAIGIGWLLRGRLPTSTDEAAAPAGLSDDYFRGLNHLLNEEQDKALAVFIRMVEVDSDTVETHFALGSLFRRRGEVDRAIRIHQNLIARPSLSRAHRQQALYELGQDYTRAGLFDRAENLFSELAQSGDFVGPALRQLMAIYEQQSDWDQAIAAAQRLELVLGGSQQKIISHYLCEQAGVALDQGQVKRAEQLVKRAGSADGDSVRPELLSALVADEGGDSAGAVKCYQRVIERYPAFAGETLEGLQESYRKAGSAEGMEQCMGTVLDGNPEAVPSIAVAALTRPRLHGTWTGKFIHRHLEQKGQGLARLLERLVERCPGEGQDDIESAMALAKLLLEDHPRYLCIDCGLAATALYWQCPSCRTWGTIRPHVDLPGSPSASALPEGTGRR